MDWKYKHLRQERTYNAEPYDVLDAAREYVGQTLGWKVSDGNGGLVADGVSFSHAARANLRTERTAEGTRLIVEMDVERAGPTGFMLFDVGGYYGIQIRKWLDGVQWTLQQKLSGGQAASAIPPLPIHHRGAACAANGCLIFIGVSFGIWIAIQVIEAIVAEFTGTLYLFGRGRPLVLHGVVARVIATLILLVAGYFTWRIATYGPRKT
ncbi:MAG TPA: hypothetical protein VI306_05160 [Pyrinomonadaceae bacterium]